METPSSEIAERKISHRNARINIALLVLFLIVVSYLFLKDTTWFSNSLFITKQGFYDAYFKDTFEKYESYSEELDSPLEDLSRWQTGGVIGAFAFIEDWKIINRIDLELKDSSGRIAIFQGIENLKVPRESNLLKSDDEFPDFTFSCDQPIKKWEDFMVVNGRNFLFWEFATTTDIDMSRIVSYRAFDAEKDIPVNDVVMHDGFCKTKNSLNGEWYSPNGLPQYGVWWPREGMLVMKNVEQEQYPSNGDHVRILSIADTTENFLWRTRFTVSNLESNAWWRKYFGKVEVKGDGLDNTYIRLAFDFDDEYDPGHEQMLVYSNFEYGYLGVQRVFPVERYFVQGYEPDQNDMGAKTELSFKNGTAYEIHVEVEGQNVRVEVYKLGVLYDRRVAKLDYKFMRPRIDKPYPFSIETTGNVEILLDEIEVRKKIKNHK